VPARRPDVRSRCHSSLCWPGIPRRQPRGGGRGYLAGDGATSNLRGVVLFDPVNNGDAVAGLAKLNGTSVPVLMIAAPPCSCNNFGAETTAIMNAAPHQFIGVELVNGSHLDSEGTSTDSVGVQFCGPAPTAANAAAVQVISSAWIKDLFTGSQSGIYGPNGAAFSIGGATGTVIGVGDKPIIQDGLPNTALHDSFADVPNGSNPTTADTGQTWGTYSQFGTNKWSVQNGAWDVNDDGTTPLPTWRPTSARPSPVSARTSCSTA